MRSVRVCFLRFLLLAVLPHSLLKTQSEAWFVWFDPPCVLEEPFAYTAAVECNCDGTNDSEHGSVVYHANAYAWAYQCYPHAYIRAAANGSSSELQASGMAQYGNWDIESHTTVYPTGSLISFGGGEMPCGGGL